MPEDITPRDTLPDVQLPAGRPAPGWQQPPLPIEARRDECTHMGRSMAMLRVPFYAEGAQWVCICGQIFVVAKTKGGKKTLRKQEDVPEADTNEPEAGVETPLDELTDVVSETIGGNVTGVGDLLGKPPKGVSGKTR